MTNRSGEYKAGMEIAMGNKDLDGNPGRASRHTKRTLTPLLLVRIQVPQPAIEYLILHILLSF